MRDGQLVFLLASSSFDVLRGHPRYERLVAEMRFPREALPEEAASRSVPIPA